MKGSNFLAFLGGAVVGGVVALLLAPQSGKETREQIRDFVDDSVDDVKDFAGDAVEKIRNTVNKSVNQAKEVIAEMRDAVCSEIEEEPVKPTRVVRARK